MRFYEEGEDLRLIDNSGLHVTMLFEPGTSRLTGVQVENVDRMDQVQQLQQLLLADDTFADWQQVAIVQADWVWEIGRAGVTCRQR